MIIVTGAAGFIGSVLVKALNDQGMNNLLLVDKLGSNGKFKNLCGKTFLDIVGPDEFLTRFAAGKYKPTAILHIGAISETTEPDADLVLKNNTHYTRHLAELSIERGIRFVYASSASVYGDGTLGFIDDDALTPKMHPLNPYAFSKWLFDAEAIRRGWVNSIVGLRFFNVFGPNEYHKGRGASVIWHSFKQIHDHHKIQLFQSHRPDYKDGEQRRDFIGIDDVVNCILWFLANPTVNGIYNVGTGQARTFNDLAKAIFAALGKTAQIEYIPTPENIRHAYQYFTQADLTKLRAAGYTAPFTPLENAVTDYVQKHLMQTNPYR